MPEAEARNPIERFFNCLGRTVQAPGTWVKENIVKPNQQSYPWYHHKFRRVPTIDQCYEDDRVCIYEADEQFKRDKKVDNEILNILRQRYEDCVMYERPDNVEKCTPLWKYYKQAEENWFIKYGDLGAFGNVKDAYMKQKHRMIWERRHGPVGTGRKDKVE